MRHFYFYVLSTFIRNVTADGVCKPPEKEDMCWETLEISRYHAYRFFLVSIYSIFIVVTSTDGFYNYLEF